VKSDSDRNRVLTSYLDPIVERFEQVSFIKDDPISIPHGFEDPQDQAIIGLYAALLAWGRRDIMMSKLANLCERMDFQPARFVRNYRPSSNGNALSGFVHRTFNDSDAEGFTLALQSLLSQSSVETVFKRGMKASNPVQSGIQYISEQIFNHVPGQPRRIQKHLARPSQGSACKRWNMYLRWMVRPGPVDLGLWKALSPEDLMMPLDVHSGTQARKVGLLNRKMNDWKAVEELTEACRRLDPGDPVKYDFALFGTGSAGEDLAEPAG
jgi:uncharacterized protein (TIGR02757 family)